MIKGQFLMTQIPKPQGTHKNSFGFLIQSLARTLDARMKVELAEIGVDIKVFANLMMLLQEDGINQRQLGKKLNFPEYFTSRNIDALVTAGLAERRPDPNSRRSFLIFLTPEGRQKASELPAIVRAVNDSLLGSFSDSEKQQLVQLLQKAAL